jgi:lactoylglutathione lyase
VNAEQGAGPNVKQAVPFLWVSDIAASVRYYVGGLGFEMTHQWVHEGKLRWCRLQLGGAALMLQEFWTEGPHADVPTDRLGVGVAIYLICEDAVAIYHAVTARGFKADQPSVGNAMWVTGLKDPDGYSLFFESPTEVPEETVLSAWCSS